MATSFARPTSRRNDAALVRTVGLEVAGRIVQDRSVKDVRQIIKGIERLLRNRRRDEDLRATANRLAQEDDEN